MATSALAYGLMGAASGLLSGLHDQWQQNQEDIRTEKLLRAKSQEAVALKQLELQYNTAENSQKIQAQLAADLTRDAAKSKQELELQNAKQDFEGQKAADDRTSREKVAGISAGATVDAANIRATSDKQPKPLGTSIWKLPDGTLKQVNPGDPIPDRGDLVLTSGGSVGARIRGNTPNMPLSTLGGLMGASSNGAATAAPVVTPTPTPAPVATPAPGGFTPAAPAAPMPGAKQAADGNWYVPDPSRPGKYQKVG